MSEETARYLASYLEQYEDEFLGTYGDRAVIHNHEMLVKRIIKFFEDLL